MFYEIDMSNKTTLSPKFQTVIPKEIRKKLNLKAGQQIEFTIKGDHIELRPLLRPEELIGFLKEDRPLEFVRESDRNIS